jgi:hypothetical protein
MRLTERDPFAAAGFCSGRVASWIDLDFKQILHCLPPELVKSFGQAVRQLTLLAVPSLGLLISVLPFHEALSVSLGLGVVLIGVGVLLTTMSAGSLRSPIGTRAHGERPQPVLSHT